ncbi:MAG: mechanosensitive ion channel family protein [Syntrophomonadaceae bacterium]|jgi:MscS family membrane protein
MIFNYINQFMHNTISILNPEYLKCAVIAIAIFFLFLLLKNLFFRYTFNWLMKVSNKTNHQLDDRILLAFAKPMKTLFVLLGLYIALLYLPLPITVDAFINRLFRSSVVIILAWGLIELTGNSSLLVTMLKQKFDMDSVLYPFFSNIARFIILALAIVIIAQEWNYDVNGFIAGLGLGGLAFALAAKDAIANLFGGIVIILEKPFGIDDWVTTSSGEGIVENISFRSTVIRSFSQSLITIPNSKLASEAIINHSRMGKRRINFYLGLNLNTSRHKIDSCVTRIKQMLIEHPGIHPETIMVYFETFNESSLDIFIYCFTNTTAWSEYLEVRQDINYKIMEILEDEEVAIALPSRSIYLENINNAKLNYDAKMNS